MPNMINDDFKEYPEHTYRKVFSQCGPCNKCKYSKYIRDKRGITSASVCLLKCNFNAQHPEWSALTELRYNDGNHCNEFMSSLAHNPNPETYLMCDHFCNPPVKYDSEDIKLVPFRGECGHLMWITYITPEEFYDAKKRYIENKLRRCANHM